MEKLIAVGVPAGAVFDTMELQNEPYFEQSGFMQHVHHHNGDDKMATWPVRIDQRRIRLKGAPSLGGDTADVLESWLGIDSGEFANLKTAGVL
jgi:formyl-CoA transferase